MNYYNNLVINLLSGYNIQLDDNNVDDFISNHPRKHQFFPFKRTLIMERVSTIISIVKSLQWEINRVLDIGTGRGSLLYPLLDSLTNEELSIECWDIKPNVVKVLNKIHPNVNAYDFNITNIEHEDVFDLVIASEVLEHIKEYKDLQKAIDNIYNLSTKYIIISVPNIEDNNEEHHRVLTEKDFEFLFRYQSYKTIKYKNIQGHLIVFAIKANY